MLRLTLVLGAVIYAVLIIYSDGAAPTPVRTTDAIVPPAADRAPALVARGDGTMTLTTETGAVLRIAAVINPSDLTLADARVAEVSTVQPDATPPPAQVAVADPIRALIVRVTGDQVNLRQGPSTDTQVIGSLTRGQEAELVATLDNGWAQIRVADTGIEGFMSDRFLVPVN